MSDPISGELFREGRSLLAWCIVGLEKLLTDVVLELELERGYTGGRGGGYCGCCGLLGHLSMDRVVTCDELEESLSEGSVLTGRLCEGSEGVEGRGEKAPGRRYAEEFMSKEQAYKLRNPGCDPYTGLTHASD